MELRGIRTQTPTTPAGHASIATDQRLARKHAALNAKVANMSLEQREARVLELVPTALTPETSQEFIKLLLGPDASFAE